VNNALARVAEAVGSSEFGTWASESALAYPVANVVHLLGLVMLVGGIGIVDLRLVGVFRAIPLEPLSRALTPVAVAGLALMLPSGATMFAADAKGMAASPLFQWKLVLIGIALANALAFRLIWGKRISGWDSSPPPLGRAMAAASLGLWLVIGTLGRLIAYS
jgi:hypothetical protein